MPRRPPRPRSHAPLLAALGLLALAATAPLLARVVAETPDRPLSELLAELFPPRSGRWVSPAARNEIAGVARRSGADPALLKGFALALNADPVAPGLTMDLSPAARELLRDGGEAEAALATPYGRLEAVGRALPELSQRLGSEEAALVALVVGLEPTRRAVEAVEARGRNPTYEQIARRLPRALRREAAATVPAALSYATAFALDWPSPGFRRLSSGFGLRIHPVKGTRRLHAGIDIPMPRLTPVAATASGRVVRVRSDRVSGRYLVLDHGRGVTSRYLHNDRILVKRGQRVHRGEIVALSGNTGRSTGPHLHYEVELAGEHVDPRTLFQRGECVAAADLASGRAERLLQARRLEPPPSPRRGLLAALVR